MNNENLSHKEVIPTHQFQFDLKSIRIEDLRKLYKHFHIEEFEDADEVSDHESFFKCFVHEETDGNTKAYLLIRLTAMLASKTAVILDTVFTNWEGKEIPSNDLFFNKFHKVEFNVLDYYDFRADGFNIMLVIYDFNIEEAAKILSKYNFLINL